MEKLPFSLYDFFGYLAAGALLLSAVDLGFFEARHVDEDPSLTGAILGVLAAYIAGHLVAGISSAALERGLVARVLGGSAHALLTPVGGWRRRVFPGYLEPLPAAARQRLGDRVQADVGAELTGEALFWHCYPIARERATTAARLATFLNLYGFCRNVATAAALAALALAAAAAFSNPPAGLGWWIAAAVVVCVGMTYRYLKFLRLYGLEVLTGYLAALAAVPSDPAPTLGDPSQ